MLPSNFHITLLALVSVLGSSFCIGSANAAQGSALEAKVEQTRVLTQNPADASMPQVVITTEFGNIVIAVDSKRAPITSMNFLRYVDEARYNQGVFYRTVTMDNQPQSPVKIEVIQGGLGMETYPKQLPAIAHETTKETGLLHKNGTVSMARLAPGTASSEIFICIGPQPELDFGGKRNPDGQGFAAFGQVISGMDVVAKIHETANTEQMINQPIKMLSVSRQQPQR